MTFQEIASADIVSFDDLRLLAAGKDLCITVVLPIPNPVGMRTRLKNAIRQVEKTLMDRGLGCNTTARLVEAVDSITTTIEAEGRWANGLILFRSPDVFRYFWLRQAERNRGCYGAISDSAAPFRIEPRTTVLYPRTEPAAYVPVSLHSAQRRESEPGRGSARQPSGSDADSKTRSRP